jgi:hypothetical protein
MTNVRPADVALEQSVEYVFRKIHDAGGKPNYFWKASPSPAELAVREKVSKKPVRRKKAGGRKKTTRNKARREKRG